jgi:hypothetical protein
MDVEERKHDEFKREFGENQESKVERKKKRRNV